MTDQQRRILSRFADQSDRTGNPASAHEALGSDAPEYPGAVATLVQAGLLRALPTEETRDDHGGTRFQLTPAGWAALDRRPQPRPVARSHGVRPVPHANGKHRKGA